jgi:SsrA-binding protein
MPAGKLIAQNKRARHDYKILDTYEAGIELVGSEVKSVKAGEISINEAFVRIRGGEAWLEQAHIKPYQASQGSQPEPARTRKLLLHRREVSRIIGESEARNHTIIPLSVYLKRGLVKLEIAVGQGKKLYDKRQTLKAKEQRREADRAVRESLR